MRSVNKVLLIGNLTRDPEMKKTVNEQYVTTLGLATNREWITKDGRKQQSAEFHELVCWGRLAEIAGAHLKKGRLIYIEGYLKTRSWDDASGIKKFRTEIVIEDLIMLERRPKDEFAPQSSDAAPPIDGAAPTGEKAEESQPSISVEDPFTI